MKRTRQAQASMIRTTEVGEVDLMSQLARRAGLPLCELYEPRHSSADGRFCTRAAGHHEGFGKGSTANHPSTHHVATGDDFIILKVWS